MFLTSLEHLISSCFIISLIFWGDFFFLLVTIFLGKMCSTFILPGWNQKFFLTFGQKKEALSERKTNRKVEDEVEETRLNRSIYTTARSLLRQLASSA